MSQTIEIEVGGLYARLHDQFLEQVGDEYEQQARQQFEEFLHNMNQQVERQMEQQQQQMQENAVELTEDDVESIDNSEKAPGNQS